MFWDKPIGFSAIEMQIYLAGAPDLTGALCRRKHELEREARIRPHGAKL
jgi:hypothetical protein